MENRWNVFEDFYDPVCVSDMDSGQIVYMNVSLRNMLGVDPSYQDQKNCSILQELEQFSPYCRKQKLLQNRTDTWQYENPISGMRRMVHDAMVVQDGHRYRVSIVMDQEEGNSSLSVYSRMEKVLNECLHHVFSSTDPAESAQRLLAYIGETFHCDRVYIFEMESDMVNNTFEWCADGIVPQKDILQKVPVSVIDWWLQLFDAGEVTVIYDVEEIRTLYPEAYAILKPQNVTDLAAGPIRDEERVVGFIGVDNPDPKGMDIITTLLNVVGYFISTLLKQRDLLLQLNRMSYHDQLTGAYNRNGLARFCQDENPSCLGVIFSDISGLKRMNDTLGHEAGDRMILSCCQIIRKSITDGCIFRTGGDEFLILLPECTEEQLQENVTILRQNIADSEFHMAVGWAWSDKTPINVDDLVRQADENMYEDKKAYYVSSGRTYSKKGREQETTVEKITVSVSDPLGRFLQQTQCDMETLFRSVSQDNGSVYFFMGDMQKGLFWISDNMRDDFGFADNLVPDFITQWMNRISTKDYRIQFREDMSGIVHEKRTVHDMRYRVRDVYGNDLWIRCYGMIRWNEDNTLPLFFSGRITHQDTEFIYDPISGLPQEHVAVMRIRQMKRKGEISPVIGFSIDGMHELNTAMGRSFGDRFLKGMADLLQEKLNGKMSFYRIEGLSFLALLNPSCLQEPVETWIEQIRQIMETCYRSLSIPWKLTFRFALIEEKDMQMDEEMILTVLSEMLHLMDMGNNVPYLIYDSSVLQRIHCRKDMKKAVFEDAGNGMEHFRIVVQPVIDLKTEQIRGGEVLLRWQYEGKDVPVQDFLPLLESQQLMEKVGRWVFDQTAATCARLRSYRKDMYLSYNVSLQQLNDADLPQYMEDVMQKYQLEKDGILVELTEGRIMEQTEQMETFMHACRDRNISLALDDFGTGYSSLHMLLRYPSDMVKLSNVLIQEGMTSQQNRDFLQGLLVICHQMGKTVCAEGMEEEEQIRFIREIGCDSCQGFRYYSPLELHELYRLISTI